MVGLGVAVSGGAGVGLISGVGDGLSVGVGDGSAVGVGAGTGDGVGCGVTEPDLGEAVTLYTQLELSSSQLGSRTRNGRQV